MKTVLAAVSVFACLTAGAVSPADASAQHPDARSFHVGKLELVSVHDAQYVMPNDGKVFGGKAGPAAVAEVLKAAGAPTDKITLSVDGLVVKTPQHLVLIDTGIGAKSGGVLMQSLKLAGITPSAVTDVLITHGHSDHIGGLVTADGALAFPKATIRMSADEWKSLQGQADVAALVKTISPRVATFTPGAAVLPGITSRSIKGHTTGHVGYEIASGQARLLDIGDTAHSSILSLQKPEWPMGFDGDPAIAEASREAVLGELAKSHETVFAPHFPFPGVGEIVAAGDHFSWKPALKPGEE